MEKRVGKKMGKSKSMINTNMTNRFKRFITSEVFRHLVVSLKFTVDASFVAVKPQTFELNRSQQRYEHTNRTKIIIGRY